MADKKRPAHLKLVCSTSDQIPGEPPTRSTSSVQAELFPMSKPWLLIFTDTCELSAEHFVQLLSQARPTFVLDIRPTPRFDMGRLNRRLAFEIFRENHIRYVDVAGLAGVSSKWDANLNPSFLAESINKTLQIKGASSEGPIVLLFDNRDLLNSAMEVFPKALLKNNRNRWDVCVAPATP